MHSISNLRAGAGVALLALSVAACACAVGPDYSGPPAVASEPYFVRADKVSLNQPVTGPWWLSLNDPLLDHLVETALAQNSDIDAAVARLDQARAVARQDRAAGLPSLGGSAVHADAKLPASTLSGAGGDEDLHLRTYSLGLSASWEPDLFGRIKRTGEQGRARADAAEASLDDVKVSLAAGVVVAYIDLRDQQTRLALARQILELQTLRFALVEQRRAAGTAPGQAVEAARVDLEQARSDLTALQSDVELSLNQLAVLTGQAPGALDAILDRGAAVPLPPAEVAVGDPAALLRRRPDVRQAERSLAAATAGIGIAKSQYFPSVNMVGLLGVGGSQPGDVFRSADLSRIALPVLSWRFLDFGATAAQVSQARAGQAEAVAAYRSAVLSALEDAEGALSRYGRARQTYLSADVAVQAGARTADLVSQMRRSGAASAIDEIDARHQLLGAEQARSEARAAVTKTFAAVQKSLGLAWAPGEGPGA
ncbi:efflux transporter outer membrane subunit [Brevundimonas sp.]|uniref:efflux transporter outer membrane subunit n=1 Tax=Brevundimonas sp. TaxID=1871086 RepID=UPI00289E669B|nr:efflux transporter outer membrane subunit [Brevundimonas sp.]